MISGALEGTVAIDISGHVAGPYAGSLLGDLGCEVIKVELPDGGDTHRGRNPKYEGYGPSFRALNRNKKSLTLNLRDKRGREILLKLLESADILLENFRPPTRKRLGLDYGDLSKLNPKLIHCSISGYGQSGPYRDKPGFHTIGQALSGMMSLVTDLDDPKVAGVSFVDHAAGIFASHGIMAALLARAKTGPITTTRSSGCCESSSEKNRGTTGCRGSTLATFRTRRSTPSVRYSTTHRSSIWESRSKFITPRWA